MLWSSSWFIGLILLSLLVFIIVLFNDPKDLDSSFDRGRWNERSKTGQCKTADPRPGVKWRLKCKVQNTDPFCLENGNTINLKSLYSLHFCFHFTPGRQSAVRSPQSAVRSPQSTFYTDRFWLVVRLVVTRSSSPTPLQDPCRALRQLLIISRKVL